MSNKTQLMPKVLKGAKPISRGQQLAILGRDKATEAMRKSSAGFEQVPHLRGMTQFFLLQYVSAGYQPRPQVVDRGTTARYGGQLRYI